MRVHLLTVHQRIETNAANEQAAVDMEADRLTRQDAKAVAKALAVAAVFWALVDFGYGWWVLGAAVLMLLLVWLAFYLERRELQRASRRWDLQSERAEANATERPQPWVWP